MIPTARINDLLNLLARNADAADIGDATGLRGSSTAGVFTVNLHTAWPGQAGNASTSVAAYANYAARTIARSTSGFGAASGGAISQAATIEFPEAGSGANETLYFWSLSGVGGKIWRMGGLGGGSPVPCTLVASSDLVTSPPLAAASPTIANGNPVVFWSVAGSGVPAGLTEGTVYFARDVSGNDFKVAASAGGSAVNITADGACLVQRLVPFVVVEGAQPTIPTLTLRG